MTSQQSVKNGEGKVEVSCGHQQWHQNTSQTQQVPGVICNKGLIAHYPPAVIHLDQALSGPILWRLELYPSCEAQETLPLTPTEQLHGTWKIQILRIR